MHPAEQNGRHALHRMGDDLAHDMQSLAARGVRCGPVEEARWGSITTLRLPGGGDVGLYQPRHPTAIAAPPA